MSLLNSKKIFYTLLRWIPQRMVTCASSWTAIPLSLASCIIGLLIPYSVFPITLTCGKRAPHRPLAGSGEGRCGGIPDEHGCESLPRPNSAQGLGTFFLAYLNLRKTNLTTKAPSIENNTQQRNSASTPWLAASLDEMPSIIGESRYAIEKVSSDPARTPVHM